MDPVLFTIGDISVTQHWVVTPQGAVPLKDVSWSVHDGSYYTEGVSQTGIILTVVFVWFCLLGLLFLLMKEPKLAGFVVVSVVGPGVQHNVYLPPGQQSAAWAHHMVGQARSIAAA